MGSAIIGLAAGLLSIVAALWYLFIWILCLFGLYRARLMFKHTRSVSAPDSTPGHDSTLPGVTILRPLAGSDSNLLVNLTSTFEQDYPPGKYQVIFSVNSPYDQALPVARQVVERYAGPGSGFDATIIVGDVTAGVNPKINNLLRSYAQARHDIIWVVDSQVRLLPTSLRTSVHHFTSNPPPTPSPTFLRRRPHGPRVGLVHHVPLGIDPDPRSMGSQVERAFLSTTHAKMYIAINSLAVDSCVMGKSNLWRKSDLAAVPDAFFAVGEDGAREGDGEGALGSEAFRASARGETGDEAAEATDATDATDDRLTVLRKSRPLARFSIYLAEDNMLALSLWRPPLSLAHVLGSSPACIARTNVRDIRTLGDYFARRCRWIRVRRYMVPAATYVEPFTESIVAGFAGLWALRYRGYIPQGLAPALLFLVLHFAAWHLVDLGVLDALSTPDAAARDDGIDAQEGDDEQWSTEAPLLGSPTAGAKSSSSSTSALFPNPGDRLLFLRAWILREALALPIWCWAMWGGNEVDWRGQPYRILSDARAARLIPSSASSSSSSRSRARARARGAHLA